MRARESRIVPIAAVVTVLVVSLTIVGLACWSGDAAGPWADTSLVAPTASREGEASAVAASPPDAHAAKGRRAGDRAVRAWMIVAPARSDAD
jgi:hypothetical protein